MTTCENCGKTFTLPEGPVEVTSSRILCPSCSAARLAEKRRQAEVRARAAAGPGAARPAAPAAPPTRPAAPAVPPARSAAPASSPARPAAPAVRAPAKAPATTRAAAPAAAPARAAAARPAERSVRETPPATGPRGRRAREQRIAEPPDKTMLIGWGLAIGISILATVVFLKVRSEKEQRRLADEKAQQHLQAVVDHLNSFDVNTAEGARALLAEIDKDREVWQSEEVAGDILSRVSRAKNTIETDLLKTDTRERFEKIQESLKDTTDLTAVELTEARRRLDELEVRATPELMGAEFAAGLAATRKQVDLAAANKLIDEARDEASQGAGGPMAALLKYAAAEDELRDRLEKSMKAGDKDAELFFTELYKKALTESDQLCATLFTPEYIQAVPWRDLLSGNDAAKWNPSQGLEFVHELAGGTLKLAGPVGSEGRSPVISIGDLEKWRDFVLDMEYTLVKGDLTLYFRLGNQVNSTVQELPITAEGPDAVVLGQRTTTMVSYIGSHFAVATPANGPADGRDLTWTRSRKGAIGFMVPEGSELIISKLRIRVLR